jgi:hypothetical protein
LIETARSTRQKEFEKMNCIMTAATPLFLLFMFAPLRVPRDTVDLEATIKHKLDALTYAGEKDDTFTVRKLGVPTGKGGVMHYVTAGHITVVALKIEEKGDRRNWIGLYNIKVKMTAHKHSLHYFGAGGNSRQDNDGDLAAEVDYRIEDSRSAVKVLDTKVLAQSGESDPGVGIMLQAATARIVQEIAKP